MVVAGVVVTRPARAAPAVSVAPAPAPLLQGLGMQLAVTAALGATQRVSAARAARAAPLDRRPPTLVRPSVAMAVLAATGR